MRKKREVEKIEDSCGDVSLDYPGNTPWENKLAAKEYDPSSEQPTPEQLMVREAVKFLTQKQKQVWELYNYDKLTHDEIAERLSITHQAVTQRVQSCEKRIAKWCKSNMGAYELLKTDFEKRDGDE